MSLERTDRSDLLGALAERLLDTATAAGVLDAAVDAGSDALRADAAVAFLAADDPAMADVDGAGARAGWSEGETGQTAGSTHGPTARRRGAAVGVTDGAGDGGVAPDPEGALQSLAEVPSFVVDDTTFEPVAVHGRVDDWLAGRPTPALEHAARSALDADGDGDGDGNRPTAVLEATAGEAGGDGDRDSAAPSTLASGSTPTPASEPTAESAGVCRSTVLVAIGARGVLAFDVPSVDGIDARDRRLAARIGSLVDRALDRTDRERALREENDRLSTFASAVAHDLKNPLSVAMGYLDLELARTDSAGTNGSVAADDGADDPVNANAAGRRNLHAVADAVSRATDIVENLLVLARSRDVAANETVPLDEAITDAWSDVDASDDRLWVDPAVGSVRCEPGLLRQLLVNLLSNAVSHGDPGCEVRVCALPDGFAVENDGEPVPVDSRSTVFEPGRSGERDGTGMGLAVVDQIAQAHGWSVVATESNAGDPRFEVTGVEGVAGHGPESD
jgi:signal transduction histidine kinase